MSLLQPSLEWMRRPEMLLVLLVWLDSINCETRNSFDKNGKLVFFLFWLLSYPSSRLPILSSSTHSLKGLKADRVSLVSHFYGTIKQTVIMTHSTRILNLLWKHQNPQITHQGILSQLAFERFQFCYHRERINNHRRTRREVVCCSSDTRIHAITGCRNGKLSKWNSIFLFISFSFFCTISIVIEVKLTSSLLTPPLSFYLWGNLELKSLQHKFKINVKWNAFCLPTEAEEMFVSI